ncbi:MAG TPA: serine acetyltransferase [bacterium]|nr:serine acetyltransferase [bacterium]
MGTIRRLKKIVGTLHRSYLRKGGFKHNREHNAPSRQRVLDALEILRALLFPGYFGSTPVTATNIEYVTGQRMVRVEELLSEEVFKSLCYVCTEGGRCGTKARCRQRAAAIVWELLEQLPAIQNQLYGDIEALFRGDPAAKHREEVILAYPGFAAIMAHRLAHFLWRRGETLVSRIINESIHQERGIDIHPGATIGREFFIDHGTGLVIGETTVIGDRVKLYQGVTLGALAVNKKLADTKRHPTIEDDVTIYAGATILGGETVVGRGSVIGGNVWLVQSVAAGSTVYNRAPEPIVRKRRPPQR